MTVQKSIWAIIDCSGSMAEDAKPAIVKMLIDCLDKGRKTMGFPTMEILTWGKQSKRISGYEGISSLVFEGYPRMNELLSQFELIAEPTSDRAGMLFLTDGHWPRDDYQAMKAWLRNHPNIKLCVVTTGCDAKQSDLERNFGGECIFRAEDLCAAVEMLDGYQHQNTEESVEKGAMQ